MLVSPGVHLILDFWGASNLTDVKFVEKVLVEAAQEANARVLDTMLHEFGDDSGVTGVIVLAESHMSIHTWPEIDYVAIDAFMCGHNDARKAIPVFEKYFKPEKFKIYEIERGREDLELDIEF